MADDNAHSQDQLKVHACVVGGGEEEEMMAAAWLLMKKGMSNYCLINSISV
jgi:hypothetical protein